MQQNAIFLARLYLGQQRDGEEKRRGGKRRIREEGNSAALD